MTIEMNRRRFLLQSGTGFGAAWAAAHWPALLSAATRAHRAMQSSTPPKLEFFTAEQAKEIDAISSRIIPTDDTPGAHEAGVVYFIDRALVTFAVDSQRLYQDGLLELQNKVSEQFPGVKNFSSATPEQQDEFLHSFYNQTGKDGRAFRPSSGAQDFVETLRQHTIAGFLIDPDTRGNPNGVGWKLIGREREHMFQPPFGFYDKDYPGWQPAKKAGEKK